MNNLPRKITEREVFDQFFGNHHETCMRMAIERSLKLSKEYNIPIECFNISAITFQLWQKWLDKQNYIKTIRDNEQKKLDGK